MKKDIPMIMMIAAEMLLISGGIFMSSNYFLGFTGFSILDNKDSSYSNLIVFAIILIIFLILAKLIMKRLKAKKSKKQRFKSKKNLIKIKKRSTEN